MDAEITNLSSRGQIVIPQNIRTNLGLEEGEKFLVVGKGDTVILKKLKVPDFDQLLKETRKIMKDIPKEEVDKAISRVRN